MMSHRRSGPGYEGYLLAWLETTFGDLCPGN
jgi:hypothetical protein